MALSDDVLKKKNYNSPTNTWPGNQPSTNIYRGQPAPAPVPAPPSASLVSQIPTGGHQAPAADGSQNSGFNTELGRNVTNTLMAVPGVGGLGRVAATTGRISTALNGASAAANTTGRVLGAASVSGAPLSAAAQQTKAAAPINFTSDNTPLPTAQTGTQDPAGPPLSAASPFITRTGNSYTGPAGLSGEVDIRNPDGSLRTQGGTLTSLPAGASLGAGRVAPTAAAQPGLRNGGAISAQNMNAAQAMSDREGLASYALAKQQIDNEASAKRNDPRQMLLNQLQGKRLNKNGAALLAQLAGTDAQERNSALGYSVGQENNRLRRDEFNREGVAVGFKNDAMLQLQKAQQAVTNAKPEDRPAALATLLALQGKTESAKDNVITLGGGQEWDATAGTMRNVPQRAIDIRTGLEIGGLPSGQNPQLPPGMKRQIGTANGRPVYEDANGKTVVAKG